MHRTLVVASFFASLLSLHAIPAQAVEQQNETSFPAVGNCGVGVGPETISVFYVSNDGTMRESLQFRKDPEILLMYKSSNKEATGLISRHCVEALRSAGVSKGHIGFIRGVTESIGIYTK
jgi:hypothetical protein